MGRKKFEKFNDNKKKEIQKKIVDKINEITQLKKSYSENLDVFEAVNDEMKDIFECDLDCSTCGIDDRGKCLQSFRLGNVFFQKQCRILVDIINEYVDVFEKILNNLGYEILKEIDVKPQKEKSDLDYYR